MRCTSRHTPHVFSLFCTNHRTCNRTQQLANLCLHLLLLITLCTSVYPVTSHAAGSDTPVTLRAEVYETPATSWEQAGPQSVLQSETANSTRSDTNDILVAVWITPKPGYHFYANTPGDTGRPTTLTPMSAPQGTVVLYPKGKADKDVFDTAASVFIHETATPFFIRFPGLYAPERTEVQVDLLLCSDTNCWPVTQTIPVALGGPRLPAEQESWWPTLALHTAVPATQPTDEKAPAADSAADLARELGVQLPGTSTSQSLTPAPSRSGATSLSLPDAGARFRPAFLTADGAYAFTPTYYIQSLEVSSLGTAIIFGLIAGLILNFMPCVLPVISLKLSSLISATTIADEQERIAGFRQHNLWFAMGILVWFVALAVMLTLAGKAWGQLFQDARLVTALLLIVFALGLSVFDVFELPMLNLRTGSTAQHGPWSAFTTGLLATLLATPCSGPFLGGVLGWAFLQPPLVLGLILCAVGIGMALPYLCLAARPGLVRLFPKPGNWTLLLQRVVGFFLMGTAAYLLTTLPEADLPRVLAWLWLTALAAWLWGRFSGLTAPRRQRWAVRITCLVLVLLPLLHTKTPPAAEARWQDFSRQQFLAHLGTRNMLVDFTADWCPNCKVLEHTVLTEANRKRWAEEHGLLYIRVDMTRSNDDAQALLEAMGSKSIPVVALFPTGKQAASPTVLRDLFTTDVAESALQSTFGDR